MINRFWTSQNDQIKLMKPLVSIIIVNWNGKKWLKPCLDSLHAQTCQNFEIIIIDNNSYDGSVELVKKLVTDYRLLVTIRLIENKSNLGFTVANNQASKIALGKYLFFLNNDTKVNPNALLALTSEMEEDNKIGICGCKMMSYDGKRYFHTGIGLDVFGFPVADKKIFYVEGSALMIRRDLFTKIDGFDPSYFMFQEDIDLAWRVRLLGYKIIAQPLAIIYHQAGASAGGGEKTKGKYQSSYLRRYYSERNTIRTLLKNYHFITLTILLPVYLLINLAEMVFYLLTLNLRVIYLYLKAYLWNICNIKDTLFNRRRIQKTRKISETQLIRNMYPGFGKLTTLLKVGIPVFK